MRVLVCGGRDWRGRAAVTRVLSTLKPAPTAIIHGACPTGADALADEWGRWWDVPVERYPADWQSHGKAAGPLRNQKMLDEAKPDLVVAFPGGRGTADMVRRAEAAGVRVIRATDGDTA